jgi:hypothetical protein
MLKYIAAIVLGVVAVVALLIELRGSEVFTLDSISGPPLRAPTGSASPLATAATPAPRGAVSNTLAAAADSVKSVATALTPQAHFSGDPATHTPAPKIYDSKDTVDPKRRELYERALADLDIGGCNRNGSFTYQLRGERVLHTLRSGESIHFSNGLALVARVAAFPSCRITFSDHGQTVAELSSF